MVLSGLGLCMSILAAHGYSISDSFIGLAVISLVETWLLGCFSFFDYLLKFDYFVDLHIVKKCGGHDKRFANALRHRCVFFFSCPTKKEFLTQAGRVLNTHPSGLATRQAVRNLVVLRSLSWTLKRKTRQNSPVKYGETAQVKQLVWLFGVIKTHRGVTWQKEWAVDGSSQLVLTGAMVKNLGELLLLGMEHKDLDTVPSIRILIVGWMTTTHSHVLTMAHLFMSF